MSPTNRDSRLSRCHGFLEYAGFNFVPNVSVMMSQTQQRSICSRICDRHITIFTHVRRLQGSTFVHEALRLVVNTRAGNWPDAGMETCTRSFPTNLDPSVGDRCRAHCRCCLEHGQWEVCQGATTSRRSCSPVSEGFFGLNITFRHRNPKRHFLETLGVVMNPTVRTASEECQKTNSRTKVVTNWVFSLPMPNLACGVVPHKCSLNLSLQTISPQILVLWGRNFPFPFRSLIAYMNLLLPHKLWYVNPPSSASSNIQILSTATLIITYNDRDFS